MHVQRGFFRHLFAALKRPDETLFVLFLFSNLGAIPKNSSPGRFTYNCHFKSVGTNAQKFAKTSIYFNSNVFTAPRHRHCFINATVPIWVSANSCDRRRKSFRIRWRKSIADRIQSIHFNSCIQNLRRLKEHTS